MVVEFDCGLEVSVTQVGHLILLLPLIHNMEKDIKSITIAPAPKTVRGYLSSLDVNQNHVLYFNAATVLLVPHDPTKPVLSLVHLADVAAVKFSPDGRLVASIDTKGTLLIN